MSTAVLDRQLLVGSSSSSESRACVEDRASIHLFGELLPGWRLDNPLPLRIERDEDGGYLAADEIFDVYGTGQSWDAAIRDYRVALVEFFEIIGEAHDEPSQRLLAHLRTYLRRG